MVKRISKLCAALLVLAGAAAAAPVQNWGGQIVDQVNQLVTAKGNVLEQKGLLLLTFIGIFKLLMLIIPAMLRRLDFFHHQHYNFAEILILLFQIALCSVALHHYTVPFPASSISVHQIPSVLSGAVVQEFDTATQEAFMGYVAAATKNTAKPNPLAFLDVIVYFTILAEMGLLSAGMFIITSFGFVGTGLFTVLGPLFIPLSLTKHFYSWFWNWVQIMFAFAAYRVMAAVIGWVWSGVYINFFVHGVGVDYSIGNWIALLPILLMLTLGFLFAMFSIPILTAMLFNGAGSIGQSYVTAGMTALRSTISGA